MILPFLVYLLAAIGAHRIWNFEDVCRAPREWLLRFRWMKPLTCQACNAFWIAAALQALSLYGPPEVSTPLLGTLAAYAVVRSVLWVYRMASHGESWVRRAALVPTTSATSPAIFPAGGPSIALLTTEAPCSDCEKKKAALTNKGETAASYKRRVVLLTTLSSFSPSYSIASVVCDHARMLSQDPTWLIEIWIHEGASTGSRPKDLPSNVVIRDIIPQVAWRVDKIIPADRDRLLAAVRSNLMALGNAVVIAHDVIFQSSFTTFAAAIHRIGALPGFAWFHVCHSAVLGRPKGDEAVTARTSLPAGHRLLCLNAAERSFLATYYATDEANVLVCPNARDVTTFGNVDPRVVKMVQKHELDDADVVQVMPLSATRLRPKGVPVLLEVFAALQRRGLKTRLVLAVAHANADEEKKSLVLLRIACNHLGLDPKTLVISSEDFPETAAEGLPATAVRDLFAVSNLFVFPSISEVSSLVVVEAALAGCLLVLNDSLHTVRRMLPETAAIYWPFGSYRTPELTPVRATDLAEQIHLAISSNMTNISRRAALKTYSHRAIGAHLRSLVEQAPLTPLVPPAG